MEEKDHPMFNKETARLYVCPQCKGTNTKARYQRGKPCANCAMENWKESLRAMREKTGPVYDRWLRNWRAATGLTLKGDE